MAFIESRARSIYKTCSYRVVGAMTGALIALLLTGRPAIALTFGLVDVVVKTCCYYYHERIWEHLPFGRIPIDTTSSINPGAEKDEYQQKDQGGAVVEAA